MRLMPLIALLALSCPASRAYFQKDFMAAKRKAKESSQWTLTDWLAQKRGMSLMDQWLMMNRSSPVFELNPGGAYRSQTESTMDTSGGAYHLDAYLHFLNIYGEYARMDDDQESFGGAAGLRLLGASSQTTGLTVRYGWRRWQRLATKERWDNNHAEGVLQIYLFKAFGLQGQYRHYFPGDSNLGRRLEGHRSAAGAFFELLIFRFYGDYFQEPLEITANGAVTKEERKGWDAGLRFYF